MKEDKYFTILEKGDKLIVILENATNEEIKRVQNLLLNNWDDINVILARGEDKVKFIVIPKEDNIEVKSS